MVLRYSELESILPSIQDLGYVRTHRSGNTGIGKTLEDLLGIKENNIAGPNGHQTEIKSSRKDTPSMMTLFTKSPLPVGVNSQLVKKFGRVKKSGKKSLHTTISAITRNKLYGNDGFKAIINETQIELDHLDYGSIPVPYWTREILEAAFLRKYPQYLLYVKAKSRGNGSAEEFHFNEAWLMSGFSFENFIDLLNRGIILIDIRLGQYKDGRLHDHGTGFRVKQDNLNLCFENRDRIM